MLSVELSHSCVRYVRHAVDRTLSTGDSFRTKAEAGGESHVGTSDLDNTALAYEVFSQFSPTLIIEESEPTLRDWKAGHGIIFVDPVDGSAEVGCGGLQFASAVSVYDSYGMPVFAAAASPGLRPIFRIDDSRFDGFARSTGVVLYGGPQGVWMEPLWPEGDLAPTLIHGSPARDPASSLYTNVALDLNRAAICGLRKTHKQTATSIARMPFSNIFSQMQVMLGQADAMTLGPTLEVPKNEQVGIGYSGPKAWDLVMPLSVGLGLEYQHRDGTPLRKLTPESFLDSFVMRERLFLGDPSVLPQYIEDFELFFR